jgi:hypothetical protein
MTAEEDAAPASGSRRFGLAPPFGRLLFVWAVTIALLGDGVVQAIRIRFHSTESYFLLHQDLPTLGLILALVMALAAAPAGLLASFGRWRPAPDRWLVFALAGLSAVVGVAGVGWVFGGYTLSLDEFMANFDAQIFASGQLMAEIPPAWRPFVPALQPMFTLPIPDNSHWASAYLPVNAAMRALALKLHAQPLVNPLLSGFSVVAVWGVGRRLWPDRPGLALIAAALLGTSAQLMVMAMTAYAMPAHLAFNLAWLWLFLRGGRLGHGGAIVVGFFATGIHQLLFHPMFALPFILQLWLDRRWGLAGLYSLAYAAIGLFWLEYWPIVMTLTGVGAQAARATGGGWFLERVVDVLSKVTLDNNFGLMSLSLIRFVTWQNPLTVPLAAVGGLAAWRAKGGHLRALALGIVITLLAMLIITPSQVHGWGYRYMHGLLGSVCLIAAYSWAGLTDALPARRRAAAAGGLALACAVSLLALTPYRAWQAWSYVRPYARANAAIQSAKADVVIVDQDADHIDMGTVTRNDALLRRPPKVMALADMNEPMARQLCAGGLDIEVFDGRNAVEFGIDTVAREPSPGPARLRQIMAQLNCGRPWVEARDR